jgi:carboxypeptidase Taq
MGEPRELSELLTQAAQLADLEIVAYLLDWDQETTMPPHGAAARANHLATIATVRHEKLTNPQIGRWLDALESWEDGSDPDSDEVRSLRRIRRDYRKAVEVPAKLAAERAHAQATGVESWRLAREASDFGMYRDSLALQIELARQYADCFSGQFEAPYDAVLDDFEPGMTAELVSELFTELQEALVPVIAQTKSDHFERSAFRGPHELADQERAVKWLLPFLGFDPGSWRLDVTTHPFGGSYGLGDIRISTRYDRMYFEDAFYGVLHEFGHGLYGGSLDPKLDRTPIGSINSAAMHESQSRTWENLVGRSRAFAEWSFPHLKRLLPNGFPAQNPYELFQELNSVQPSLIRVDAEEYTYNLHLVLRFELERAIVNGELSVDELPAKWNEEMMRLLGVEVPNDAQGVLQDPHWAGGAFGYFPTYTIGNMISAQLWEGVERDVPEIHSEIEKGNFAPLREWQRDNVHQHAARYSTKELLDRVVGEPLSPKPLINYLTAKLKESGRLT